MGQEEQCRLLALYPAPDLDWWLRAVTGGVHTDTGGAGRQTPEYEGS